MSAPLSEKEAKSGQDLLIVMGNIMATWQGVEHAVHHLYLVFFRPHRMDSATTVFFAVRTFDARVTLVDALITQYCDDDTKAKWAKIFQAIRRKGARRNAVAHGLVALYGRPPDRDYRIGATPFDRQRCPDPSANEAAYTVRELESICAAFTTLAYRIMAFATDVSIETALHPEFAEPQGAIAAIEARYPLIVPLPEEPPSRRQPSDPSPQSDDQA